MSGSESNDSVNTNIFTCFIFFTIAIFFIVMFFVVGEQKKEIEELEAQLDSISVMLDTIENQEKEKDEHD